MSGYEYQNLNPGLSIYKQKRSKNWYIRLRIKEGDSASEFVKSLRTSDKAEATQKAWSYFFAQRDNLSPELFVKKPKSKVTFLAKELVKELSQRSKTINKTYIQIINNEIIPEFGSRSITDLNRIDLKQYISKNAKSGTQVQVRKTALKHLFELAVDFKILKEYQIPSIPSIEVANKEVRSMFSDIHLSLFEMKFDSFIDSSRKSISRRYRTLFRHYMKFLYETGIRPGEEAIHIKIEDLTHYPEKMLYTVAITKGKIHSKSKSSSRVIPLSEGAKKAITSILNDIHGIDLPLKEVIRVKAYNNIALFRLPEVEAKPQFEKTFVQLCDHCCLPYQYYQYSLYSFRHTYITRKLVEGVDAYLLATHCGTSVEMIQKNYSKLTSVMRSKELVGSWAEDPTIISQLKADRLIYEQTQKKK